MSDSRANPMADGGQNTQPPGSSGTQQGRQQPQQPQGGAGGAGQQPGYGGRTSGSSFGPEFPKFGKFAVGVHLLGGLGFLLSLFLFFSLAPGDLNLSNQLLNISSEHLLFTAAIAAFGFSLLFTPLVSVGVGLFVGRTSNQRTSAPLVGGVGNAAGVAVNELVVLLLATLFAPEMAQLKLGDVIAPVIGLVIAAAIIGAVAGWLGDRVEFW